MFIDTAEVTIAFVQKKIAHFMVLYPSVTKYYNGACRVGGLCSMLACHNLSLSQSLPRTVSELNVPMGSLLLAHCTQYSTYLINIQYRTRLFFSALCSAIVNS